MQAFLIDFSNGSEHRFFCSNAKNIKKMETKVLETVANVFAENQKDYYFGNISDVDLLKVRVERFGEFINELNKFSIRKMFFTLNTLLATYVEFSQDDKDTKGKILENLNSITHLLETLSVYADDVEIWGSFFDNISEKLFNEL